MKIVARLTFLLISASFAICAYADRYYTWIDENGEVRHTLISEPDKKREPVTRKTEPTAKVEPATVQEHAAELDNSSSKTLQKNSDALNSPTEPGSEANHSEVSAETVSVPEVSKGNDEAENDVGKAKIADHDVAKNEGEGRVNSSATSQPEGSTPSSVAHSVRRFEGEDYVDAEDLAAGGFAPAKPQRFYTVIDSDGSYRNIPYPEDAEISAEPNLQPVLPESFQVVANEQLLEGVTPGMKADSYAVELFGLESDRREIDIVADHCCEALKTFDRVELDLSEGNLLEINEKDYSHQFGLGSSLVRIITLPETEEELTLGIRTYAGPKVFYPSVLVLDSEFKPQRLIQDIVYVYEPENWFRYGYLEGYFKVSPTSSRYLVIFTTKEDERKRTVVEGIEDKPIILNHAGMGIVHLSKAGTAE
ncbi:hypothetical protein BTA51_21785 [Hahella sp. CCB-MM4]|uniref:MalM family protein n=1 Tax=Hahella sp. (strain CCB-MM4) TaxID=1926491 RepID=UPI000B9C6557|nr:MalM family protein [Hahella sp. CCB-MM4]OZG71280.1 hypothetical protein BTA51_21785 [Hahella sp. CCB-MM4]